MTSLAYAAVPCSLDPTNGRSGCTVYGETKSTQPELRYFADNYLDQTLQQGIYMYLHGMMQIVCEDINSDEWCIIFKLYGLLHLLQVVLFTCSID